MPDCFRIRNRRGAALLGHALAGMPALSGDAIVVAFQPELTTWRGKLRSSEQVGTPVHAGTDLRRRTMVLDSGLLGDPDELARIFVHEAHHFVWPRLGNARRSEYEATIAAEIRRGVTGELGWSAEVRKNRLQPVDLSGRTRLWRTYVCESFCDSAAWMYACLMRHQEWTLPVRFRRQRARRLIALLEGRAVPV